MNEEKQEKHFKQKNILHITLNWVRAWSETRELQRELARMQTKMHGLTKNHKRSLCSAGFSTISPLTLQKIARDSVRGDSNAHLHHAEHCQLLATAPGILHFGS